MCRNGCTACKSRRSSRALTYRIQLENALARNSLSSCTSESSESMKMKTRSCMLMYRESSNASYDTPRRRRGVSCFSGGNFVVLFVCRKISWGKNSFPPKKYPNVSIGLNWGKNIPQYTNAEKTQKGEFSLSKRRRGTILPHVFYHRRVCFC